MLNALLKGKTSSTFVQLFRYGLVAGVAMLVDVGTFTLLTRIAGVNYLVANAISFCFGLTTNYLLSVIWVFDQRRVTNRALEFTGNALIAVTGLGFRTLILWLLVSRAELDSFIALLCAIAIVFWWNFFAKKKLLFTVSEK